jgi:hypothetical protein
MVYQPTVKKTCIREKEKKLKRKKKKRRKKKNSGSRTMKFHS